MNADSTSALGLLNYCIWSNTETATLNTINTGGKNGFCSYPDVLTCTGRTQSNVEKTGSNLKLRMMLV